jgi:hypothetical protein
VGANRTQAIVPQDIEVTYKKIQFDGRFVEENIYRKPAPSPETDAAWEALGVRCTPQAKHEYKLYCTYDLVR